MTITPPSLDASTRRRRRSPWLVLVAAIAIQGATGPGQTVGVSAFVDPLASDLDLGRSAVSLAYLLGTLAGALTLVPVGRFIDRRGVRTAVLVFGTGFGAVLIAMSGVIGFVTLAIGFGGTRALGQGALTLSASTTVAVWFDERRGLANGMMAAAGGALMAMIPIVSTLLIGAVGWRTAWVVLGVGVWAVVLPLGIAVIRDPRRIRAPRPSPTERGTDTAADGDDGPDPGPDLAADPGPEPDDGSWPVAAVLRHPAFWIVTGSTSLAALVGTALMFHHIDLLTGRGLTATEAAAVFLPVTLASAAAALVVGRLADRRSARVLLVVALTGLIASPLLALTARPGALAIAYGVVLGATGAALRTIEATVLPRWFGTAAIGQIRGVVMTTGVAASALGPLVLSLGVDLTGGYGPMLVTMAVPSGVLALTALRVGPPGPRPVAGA